MSATQILNEKIGIEGPTVEEIKGAKPKKSIALGVCKFITGVCEAIAVTGAIAPSIISPETTAGAAVGSILWGLLTHAVKETHNATAVSRQKTAFVDHIREKNPETLTIDELGKLVLCDDRDLKKLPIPLQIEVAEADRDFLYHTAKEEQRLPESVAKNIDIHRPVGRTQDSLSRVLVERDHLADLFKEDAHPGGKPWKLLQGFGIMLASFMYGFSFQTDNHNRDLAVIGAPMALSALSLKNGVEPPPMDKLPSLATEISDARKSMDKPVLRRPTPGVEPH